MANVLPFIPNVIKSVMQWTVGNDSQVFTIHHWKYSGTRPSGADLTVLAGTIVTATQTNFGPLSANTTLLPSVTVTDLTDNMGNVGSHAGGAAGTGTGQALAASCAFLTSWTVGRHYRGGHPRTYWPIGTATALASPQTWNILTSMNTAVTTWRNAIIGSAFGGSTVQSQMSIGYYGKPYTIKPGSSQSNPIAVPTLLATPNQDVIVGFINRTNVATQRRRVEVSH